MSMSERKAKLRRLVDAQVGTSVVLNDSINLNDFVLLGGVYYRVRGEGERILLTQEWVDRFARG